VVEDLQKEYSPRAILERNDAAVRGFEGLPEQVGVLAGEEVKHPPQSGWLDEWGRLEGGRPLPSIAFVTACLPEPRRDSTCLAAVKGAFLVPAAHG
jgi:hypothetical protein